jgi:hypothetical protein
MPICIVLEPGTTGEVLKWKVIALRSDTVQESAGTLFTVKAPTPQPPNGSTGQLTLTLKSVGGGKKNVPQGAEITTHVSVGVVVAVGVGVTVTVGVGVFDGVDRRFSGRGALRIDESDAACRCVYFVESGGRKFTCIADRFQPVCRNRNGISFRGRFAIYHRASAKNNRAERLQSNLRSS